MPSISISDKIQHPTLHHLLIYKEGIFWVAYEQSAYFIAQHKGYKPTKRYYKNIKQSVVSVGFPKIDRLLDELMQNNCISEVTKLDTTVEILLKEHINSADFELWKENLFENTDLKSNQKASINDLVKAFPLAHKTPMDAFLFIKELQKSINTL